MDRELVLLSSTNTKHPERCIILNPEEVVRISLLTFDNSSLWVMFVNSSGQEIGLSLNQHSGEKLPLYIAPSAISFNGFYFKFEKIGSYEGNHSVEFEYEKVKISNVISNIRYIQAPKF